VRSAPLGTPRTASRIRGSGCRRRAGARLLLAGDQAPTEWLQARRNCILDISISLPSILTALGLPPSKLVVELFHFTSKELPSGSQSHSRISSLCVCVCTPFVYKPLGKLGPVQTHVCHDASGSWSVQFTSTNGVRVRVKVHRNVYLRVFTQTD